jgi:hypothetical protein
VRVKGRMEENVEDEEEGNERRLQGTLEKDDGILP